MQADHAYWVSGVDRRAARIDLRNPHGYKDLPGLSVRAFKALFHEICVLDKSIARVTPIRRG